MIRRKSADINALNKQIQKYTDQIKQRIKDTQEFTKQVKDITAEQKNLIKIKRNI